MVQWTYPPPLIMTLANYSFTQGCQPQDYLLVEHLCTRSRTHHYQQANQSLTILARDTQTCQLVA